jgi:predicted nucleotide-binding protein
MPTKRKIVAEFTRDELWRTVDRHDLPVEDRRKLDDLQAAVRRLSRSVLREILLDFDRDRLKTICRTLGLDDGGKLKAEIVDRLVGGHDTDSGDDSEPETKPKPGGGSARLLSELNRDELWHVIDTYGLSVEDRRRREDVFGAAARLSVAQLGTVLKSFARDRLKEICRALGLDDSGKRKAELVGRLLGEPIDDANDDVKEESEEEEDEVPAPGPRPDPSKGKGGRPRLFIGSTVEALPVAREVQAELDHEFQVTLWNQNLFNPGDLTWSRLVEMARSKFDFAILVFSADDVVESRGKSSAAPRDNVLLEYGLFVGAVGPDRTFFLYNRDHPPKIASDLAGVTALTYGDRDDDNLQAAVGPACTGLRKRYAKLGRLIERA